jgi:hypothetical protein
MRIDIEVLAAPPMPSAVVSVMTCVPFDSPSAASSNPRPIMPSRLELHVVSVISPRPKSGEIAPPRRTTEAPSGNSAIVSGEMMYAVRGFGDRAKEGPCTTEVRIPDDATICRQHPSPAGSHWGLIQQEDPCIPEAIVCQV